jgi:hypothetical protein
MTVHDGQRERISVATDISRYQQAVNLAGYRKIKARVRRSEARAESQGRRTRIVRWISTAREKGDPWTIAIAFSGAVVALIAIITFAVTVWPK